LTASLRSVSADAARFVLAAQVTFAESAGGAGRITRVSVTIESRGPGSLHASGVLSEQQLSIPAHGTVTVTYTVEFDVGWGENEVVWRLSAEGVDARERPFQVPQVELPVAVTMPARPG
jgi:hypothetical protein